MNSVTCLANSEKNAKGVKWRLQVPPRPAYPERRYHRPAHHLDQVTTELVEEIVSIVNEANVTVAMTGRLRDTSQYLLSVVLVLATDRVRVFFSR
jgi:hypothetical protein